MARKTRKGGKPVEERKAEVKALLQRLDDGVKSLRDSDEWKRFLSFRASFRSYSFRNCILMLSQRPDASLVCGFRQWKEHGRSVRKGETAIRILAPSLRKVTREEEDGTTTEERRVAYFRTVCVFDVSQTEGEDLPSPCTLIAGDGPDGLFAALQAFSESRGVPVSVEPVDKGNGFYDRKARRIAVKSDLDRAHRCKTLAHEIAHSILHADRDADGMARDDAELEAESVAFVVCKAAGLDTSAYSFGYLASWKGADSSKTLAESAERITRAAFEILDAIGEQSG
jgi:antirestriction protein ArdC